MNVSWNVVERWKNDPEVIEQFVVYWFPYESEKDQATRGRLSRQYAKLIRDNFNEMYQRVRSHDLRSAMSN